MNHLRIIIWAIAMFLSAAAISGRTRLPIQELRDLDRAMALSEEISRKASQRSDSLKRLLSLSGSEEHRAMLLINISRLYRQSRADSSLHYSYRAVRESVNLDNAQRFRASLAMADALGASGFFSQAIQLYDSLPATGLDKPDRIEYFKAGRRIYSNLCNYMDGQGLFYSHYVDKYAECDDSLTNLLPETDPFRKFIVSEKLVSRGRFREADQMLSDLLKSLKKGDNLYGMAAFQLATVRRSEGDSFGYAAYLAKAAESDILGGVREGYALPALAAWLYQESEFDTAFKYINFALEEAYLGNARVRMVSMSRWVPAIDEAYRHKISASQNELVIYVVFTSLLLVALAILSFFLIRQIRKGRRSRQALAASSRLKDFYIGNFIGLCSTYAEKYSSLIRLVDRKISSGQASELLKTLKSGKIDESEDEDFYKQIDSVVMSLYPDFVERMNDLLRPEDRITITDGSLTPELRIYAFVRLGVSESTRIAKILNYSVNTVYAYRNRMRNRAIDRENFESDVMRIGTEDENAD